MTVTRITCAEAWPGHGGSHLVGHIDATTADFTAVLGPPDNVAGLGDCQVELEWYVRLDDGTVVNIYNMHDGGVRPIPPPDRLVCWHIGSHDDTAADRLADALNTAVTVPAPKQGWSAWAAEHLGGQSAIGEPAPPLPPHPRKETPC